MVCKDDNEPFQMIFLQVYTNFSPAYHIAGLYCESNIFANLTAPEVINIFVNDLLEMSREC